MPIALIYNHKNYNHERTALLGENCTKNRCLFSEASYFKDYLNFDLSPKAI